MDGALRGRLEPQQLPPGLEFAQKVTDPDEQRRVVREAYRTIGCLLDDLPDPALLVDALCKDFPIVGASKGFCDLTGYTTEQVLGQNCRLLLEGVPSVAISRSSRKNIQDYCSMCQAAGLKEISEVTSVQPNARADGSHFVNFFMLGVCRVRRRHFILGVLVPLGEGLFVKLAQPHISNVTEQTHQTFKRIRSVLRSAEAAEGDEDPPSCMRHAIVAQPDFAFFAERMQDHCLLVNNGFTAIRREPQELAFNCLVFGDRPVRRTSAGLRFTVHVDEVTPTFSGLPVLGFTRRQPVDSRDLYPGTNKCLGASVLVGACGEAFVRDKREHFKMGFKQPPSDEIQMWALQPDLPSHKRTPPVCIARGDLLHCVYTWGGHIVLMQNEKTVIEFDVERPIDEHTDYYAVVDVCFSAYSLTIMPSAPAGDAASPQEGAAVEPAGTFPAQVSAASEQSTTARTDASFFDGGARGLSTQGNDFAVELNGERFSRAVNDVLIKKSIKETIAGCKFMVTIADPMGQDCPLIAVSEEFETMTGFKRNEILGVNCRFLNQGCDMDPADLASLRISSQTGAPFTAVLPNRKKSGELFLNLLDLRGLNVAVDPVTREELWFLVGIQADVTDMAEEDFPRDHLAELQLVADGIRASIKKELSHMAMSGATEFRGTEPHGPLGPRWQLMEDPTWRPGAPDSPLADGPAPQRGPAACAPPPAACRGDPLSSEPPARRPPAVEPVAGAPPPKALPAALQQPITRGEALLLASAVLFSLGGLLIVATRRRS